MSAQTAAEIAYKALLAQICDLSADPRFEELEDIPQLGHAAVAIVLAAKPLALDELSLSPETLAQLLGQPISEADQVPHRLGLYLAGALHTAARAQLRRDAQAEMDQRREDDAQDRADSRYASGDHRTTEELAADDAGVASLFRAL